MKSIMFFELTERQSNSLQDDIKSLISIFWELGFVAICIISINGYGRYHHHGSWRHMHHDHDEHLRKDFDNHSAEDDVPDYILPPPSDSDSSDYDSQENNYHDWPNYRYNPSNKHWSTSTRPPVRHPNSPTTNSWLKVTTRKPPSVIQSTPPNIMWLTGSMNTFPPTKPTFINWNTNTKQSTVVTTNTESSNFSPLLSCIQSCPTTNQYSPLCGSDGVTYNNILELQCVQGCGVKISIQSESPCSTQSTATNNIGSTTESTTTTTSDFGWTVTLSRYQQCMKLCDITPDFNPVCGTDHVTYVNMDRLKCAKECGNDIEVLCEKSCPACPKNTPSKTTPPSPTGMNHYSQAVRDCLQKTCPPSAEYSPVCGSDGVTYNNPGHLLCAQICGVDVKVTRLSACGSSNIDQTTTTESTASIRDCQRTCPTTSEYNPICGSDGITYLNPSRIDCAKYCGVRVVAVNNLPCNVTSGSSISQMADKTPLPTTSPKIPGTTLSLDFLTSIFDIPGVPTPPPDYDIQETDIRFGETTIDSTTG